MTSSHSYGALRIALTALILLSRPLRAQGDPTRSSVEGDVYFVTKAGDVKKAAANTVLLVRQSAQLRTELDRACAQIKSRSMEVHSDSEIAALFLEQLQIDLLVHPKGGRDVDSSTAHVKAGEARLSESRARLDSARTRIDSFLRSETVANSPTGMNAHYRFVDVLPGGYILLAFTKVGDVDYTWFAPFTARTGQAATIDLDNSVLNAGAPYCVGRN